jgi:NAD(P)-dependent dehydrogenase (short-subunit alcohol dehydrogenase family)
VVTLSSIAHKQTPKLWIDDLDYENRRYQRNLAYAQSKLCNLMFARELQRRLRESGSDKRSYGVHPGVSATDLFAHTETPLDYVSKPFIRLIGHSPAKAAHSTLFAATMPDADPEIYWGPTRLFGSQGPVRPSSSTRLSQNRELWQRLWAESERKTGVIYPF